MDEQALADNENEDEDGVSLWGFFLFFFFLTLQILYFKQACLLIFQVNCHTSFSQDTDSLMEWWNTVERESQSDLFTLK